jgi:hypothetical protein
MVGAWAVPLVVSSLSLDVMLAVEKAGDLAALLVVSKAVYWVDPWEV